MSLKRVPSSDINLLSITIQRSMRSGIRTFLYGYMHLEKKKKKKKEQAEVKVSRHRRSMDCKFL